MKKPVRYDTRLTAMTALATVFMAPAAYAQSASSTDTQVGGLADIIVTAQRRAENLQDVPIAVTAIGSDLLESSSINASNDLPQIVPSVQFTRSGPSGMFFIRGVGTTNGATGEEGANAVYVDNVYMADLGQTVNRFNNVQRVEVLKGPQGTLFGRNATGGLIHVITRDPPKEGSELKGEVGYGNHDTLTGKLYFGGAATDTLRFDVAFTGENQGKGWGKNANTGDDIMQADYWGLRSKVVFEPSSAVKFTLAGDYFRNKDDSSLYFSVPDEAVQMGGFGPTDGHESYIDKDIFTDNRIWGVSLTGEVDLGGATITSVTAYRQNNTRSLIDMDATPLDLLTVGLQSNTRSFQQELRIASDNSSPFSWQAGVFYLNGKARGIQNQAGGLFTAIGTSEIDIDAAMKTDSIALFGEASYDLTPTTHITAGLRYTKDRREFEGGRTITLANGFQVYQTQADPKLSYGEYTYRLSVRQDLTDDINIYVSYNHGFKAGAFSLQSPVDAAVQPQFIDAYEIGLKSQLFDRRLRLNLSAYRYDISNYQVRSGASSAAPGSSILLNAAKVKVEGVDVEFEAAPTDNLNIFGGLTWLSSRFKSFGGPGADYQAPMLYPNFTTATTCASPSLGLEDPGILGSGSRVGGWVTCSGNVSGNRTAMAPKIALSLGGSFTIPTGDESGLSLTALYSYNDGFYFEPDNVVEQKAYSLVNASAEYRFNNNLALEFWGRNLGDTTYAAQKLSSAPGTSMILGAPRSYGATVKFQY